MKRFFRLLLKIPLLYLKSIGKIFKWLFDDDYNDSRSIFKRRKDSYEEYLGSKGEVIVANMLNSIKDDGYLINDVILKYRNMYTQIDHILLHKSGIYVIETKNISGRVYGKDGEKYWTQVLSYGDIKNRIYNPVLQNRTHINILCSILREYNAVFPLVIFVKGNTEYVNSDNVYTLLDAECFIRRRLINKVYTDEELKTFYDKLIDFKNNPPCTKEEYIEMVHSRY